MANSFRFVSSKCQICHSTRDNRIYFNRYFMYFIIFNKLKMIVKISENVLWSILSGVILSLNIFYYKYLLGSKHEYSSREAELRNMCWLYKQYVLRKSFRVKLMDEALSFNYKNKMDACVLNEDSLNTLITG